MKRMLKLVLFLAVAYVLLCVAAFLFQRKLIFFSFGGPVSIPLKMGIDAKKVQIPVSDSVTLTAWWASKGEAPDILIWCHGNAGSINSRGEEFKRFVQSGFNVLLFDYRGYGESTGSPAVEGIFEDVLAVYHFLLKNGVEWHTIIPYGRSLGSGPALHLANQRDVAGLILVSPITSTLEMGQHAYPFLPIKLLLREIIDNRKELRKYNGPLLVLHGSRDDVVPFDMGRKLFEGAKSRDKTFITLEGADHNSLGVTHSRDLIEAMALWMNDLH